MKPQVTGGSGRAPGLLPLPLLPLPARCVLVGFGAHPSAAAACLRACGGARRPRGADCLCGGDIVDVPGLRLLMLRRRRRRRRKWKRRASISSFRYAVVSICALFNVPGGGLLLLAMEILMKLPHLFASERF